MVDKDKAPKVEGAEKAQRKPRGPAKPAKLYALVHLEDGSTVAATLLAPSVKSARAEIAALFAANVTQVEVVRSMATFTSIVRIARAKK